MSTYAIGDIQGCYKQLQALLTLIKFNPDQDKLWFTGDLVNRGPQSLEVLRFVKGLGDKAVTVLGNHDTHLLFIANGHPECLQAQDTLETVLQAPDCHELLDWLRCRPLLHHDDKLGFTLIHAGLPPQWDFVQTRACAQEVEEALRSPRYDEYLQHIHGNKPKQWSKSLKGYDRLRFILNCFTRLRYCSSDGTLNMKKKNAPSTNDPNDPDQPWFLLPNRASQDMRIIFGHWATLGLHLSDNIFALDTGCLWGGCLTAMRLEDKQLFKLDCPQTRAIISG
ncbi:symmetrical bis(5'-nucleosyl)-tetraphosphatase [Beggiatoa leptomitoformis]|uniref:Bis(5'-nucleosyl)-tetraphosphatase, symmetrical n=1 Tax=Beggiatoa leptomitoformis TaxID=288004 RepID=A0A2N9YE64_9GAMM|nr:symmetrical bis(5'-nucleosyl)-tetraphosphatase [Beggiatoa leptomitoformis]ALG68861.1 symmetrical bis(5'-nucleosyl)-tetraphosphatase [Beggiatoa leptomitoformis]AUI68770.1 symmetrical bis(5'-nucleosyl)-tetraphosphatase [Beggiatoa leptomitoformis]